MIKFIDNIICCLIVDVLMTQKTSQKALFINLDTTNKTFALKLYKNSNAVTFKT